MTEKPAQIAHSDAAHPIPPTQGGSADSDEMAADSGPVLSQPQPVDDDSCPHPWHGADGGACPTCGFDITKAAWPNPDESIYFKTARALCQKWGYDKTLDAPVFEEFVALKANDENHRFIVTAVLEDAYRQLRRHARGYRDTKAFRKAQARLEAGEQERGHREVAVHEFFARGLEAGARDLAELLGVPEHDIDDEPEADRA